MLPGIIPGPKVDADGLRPYQREAVDAWNRDLEKVRAALGVIFTGGGKTRTATAWIRHRRGRGLWLAMRDFLIDQAADTIRERAGELVSIEKADQHMDGTRIVVGSVQTLRDKRLADIPPDRFDWIVFDEAHHAVAPGPMAIFDHFGKAKIIGLTATPFRLDNVGLRNIFDVTSFEYNIRWGMDEGYFCPVVPVRHDVDEIDVSAVKSTMGDLQIRALEEKTIKAAAQIARLTFEESEQGKLPFIVYTPGVASAHLVSKTLCELAKDDSFCASVDQETPKWRRRQVLSAFGGSLRGIANCQIYTEGLDVPLARCIVIARLTESLSLYQQMAGRGGRNAPGCSEHETREERLAAIAASAKPWFKLVDITGNAGRHKLITAFDALAGDDVPEPVIRIAEEIVRSSPGTTLDEAIKKAKEEAVRLEREELELHSKRIAEAAAGAEVKTRRSTFDPFTRLGADEEDSDGIEPEWIEQKPTAEQLHWLRENKLSENISRGKCAKLQRQAKKWKKLGLASFRQRSVLAKFNLPVDIPSTVAQRIIGTLIEYRWKIYKAQPEINRILATGRTPGEEG
jgi:superfamily II DNA or RNA helicase